MKNTYHYLYKITCLITGKYYFGIHSTKNMDDGYFGSGKILKRSITKYTKEHHKMEIIQETTTRNELVELEKNIVTEELLNDPLCMNIRLGGCGGGSWTKEQQQINNKKSQEKQKWLRENDPEWKKKKSEKQSKKLKEAHENGSRTSISDHYSWVGRKHSEKTLEKLKKSKNVGDKNPMFGKIWITDGTSNKLIKKEEDIPTGWKRGKTLR